MSGTSFKRPLVVIGGRNFDIVTSTHVSIVCVRVELWVDTVFGIDGLLEDTLWNRMWVLPEPTPNMGCLQRSRFEDVLCFDCLKCIRILSSTHSI